MKKINLILAGLAVLVLFGLLGFLQRLHYSNLPTQLSLGQNAITQATSVTILAKTFSNLTPAPTGLKVPILMYHHVGIIGQGSDESIKSDPTAIDLMVSPQDFETQVRYFKNLGYHPVSLSQVYDALENKAAMPAKPIVFTFDDGFKDVFENAVPILQKYGYTGTFAIATQLLGRPTYATWEDVIAAQKQGMEIVSHTENHLDLTSAKYSNDDLKREIFDSKTLLEQKLGCTVDFFVYPYGRSDQKVRDLVGQAGYKLALTTAYGQYVSAENFLHEPRVRVHGQNGLDKLMHIFEPWKFPKLAVSEVPSD